MKIFPHRILKKLDPEFEDSIHCKEIKPLAKNDFDIWNYAKANDYLIVTFDEDFYEWMLLKSFPPKIIWLRSGNSSTNNIARLINKNILEIKSFLMNDEVGIIELF